MSPLAYQIGVFELKTREVYTPEYAQRKFLRKLDDVVYYFGVTGELYAPDSRGAISIRIDEDWELVREPVDFMTAINSGKSIRPEGHDDWNSPNSWLAQRSMKLEWVNGKWLIE